MPGFFPCALAKKKKKDHLFVSFYCLLNSLNILLCEYFCVTEYCSTTSFVKTLGFHNLYKLVSIQKMPIMRLRLFPTFGFGNNCIINITVREPLCISVIVSLGFIPRNGIARLKCIWIKFCSYRSKSPSIKALHSL